MAGDLRFIYFFAGNLFQCPDIIFLNAPGRLYLPFGR